MAYVSQVEIVVRTVAGDYIESFKPGEQEAARAHANKWFDDSGEHVQVVEETSYYVDKTVIYSTYPEDPDVDDDDNPFA